MGRELELTQLHGWFAKALRGERQLVFVTGEAGIGKTALVEAFVSQVGAIHESPLQDGRVWIGQGQCIEHFGAGEAYLPILSALSQLGRESGHEHLAEVLAQYAPTWLVQLSALVPPTELDLLLRKTAGATQERMLREMAEAIETLTAE